MNNKAHQESVITQEVPMDIDPGEYFIILILVMLKPFVDGCVSSLPVCRLLYSLVPGIIINSWPFLKAISIIVKQQETSDVVAQTADAPITGSSIQVPKGKNKLHSGMFLFTFSKYIFLSFY